jgi:hypothetical protein
MGVPITLSLTFFPFPFSLFPSRNFPSHAPCPFLSTGIRGYHPRKFFYPKCSYVIFGALLPLKTAPCKWTSVIHKTHFKTFLGNWKISIRNVVYVHFMHFKLLAQLACYLLIYLYQISTSDKQMNKLIKYIKWLYRRNGFMVPSRADEHHLYWTVNEEITIIKKTNTQVKIHT